VRRRRGPELAVTRQLRHKRCGTAWTTRAYRGSDNLRASQALLAHSSIATTQLCTAVDDDEIRAGRGLRVTCRARRYQGCAAG